MLWHIGNTTVRTPYRLRDALRVLQGSPLNGNISGREQENAFAKLLHTKGILDAPRVASGQDASDLGRKWRSALSQLGFITSQLNRNIKSGTIGTDLSVVVDNIEKLSGRPYEITPNGHRLIESGIITAQQECFLRSLVSYRIPSILEKKYKVQQFSPLQFVLQVMEGLGAGEYEKRLSFQEFALFVQTASPKNENVTVINNILSYRKKREVTKGNFRTLDRKLYEKISSKLNKRQSTLDDYADLSLRYLKATGVFRAVGRGITLSSSRIQLAKLLQTKEIVELSNQQYLRSIWLGAELPTDDATISYSVIQDIEQQLKARGEKIIPLPADTSLPDLEIQRHVLEAKIFRLDEENYANQQAENIDEIVSWMKAIQSNKPAQLPNGEMASIPRGERPAYFEWVIWRSFLAIDSLHNKPWEARMFQIDQDFLPVSCAPGNRPDMVFEFKDVIVVVEVTLTSSSRQEAAEGEPVRRHVAQYKENAPKPVYGLFIALSIDSNTAHTFRSGDWYLGDDRKVALDIVPLTLHDFSKFLVSGKGRFSRMPALLKQLIMECRAKANQDALQWKRTISAIVSKVIEA